MMVIIQEFSNSLGNNSIISEHLINQHPNLNQLFNLIVHPMGLIKGGGMLYIKGLHIQTIFFVNSPKHLGVTMKDIKTLMIGFLLATCMFLIMGFTDKEINEKKKWMKEFAQNGRYLPLKINKEEMVVMMDSQTGDLYFPSNDGWKIDMSTK